MLVVTLVVILADNLVVELVAKLVVKSENNLVDHLVV